MRFMARRCPGYSMGLLAVCAAMPPAALAAQSSAVPSAAAARDSLRSAEERISEQAFGGGLAGALTGAMSSDAVLLLEGAPIVRGRDAIERLLRAQPALRDLHVSWSPFRVLISRDQTLGVTFGGTVVPRNKGLPPSVGRYMTIWRRSGAGTWQVAAHLQNGLLSPRQVVLLGDLSRAPGGEGTVSDPFAETDRAFAKLAADSGAPAAFARFIAPDGMTLAPSGELNIGPATVRARMAEGRAATASWQWEPVVSFAAASGDLGATIGEAEIRPQGAAPTEFFYSKYLSIWQRQPDGSLKFVIDGGSSRPPPR